MNNYQLFSYDELDRLTSAQGTLYGLEQYQYNEIGNILQKGSLTLSYGGNPKSPAGPHAVTSVVTADAKTFAYRYDANGNLTFRSDYQQALSYDAENRLTAVNKTTTNLPLAKFYYDGDGGRVRKDGYNGKGRLVTTNLYIGSLYEKEATQTDALRITNRRYIYLGSNRVACVSTDSQQTTTNYFHSDHLGSTSVVSKGTTGEVIQQCSYKPFGETVLNNRASSFDTAYKFTGKELDDETNLYYYGARYYDPFLGRFITPDSIVQAPSDPQSLNRYSYCRNNPLKYTDPSGHWWWWVIPAIIGALLGAATSAIMRQPIWQGAIVGAIGGVVFGGIGQLAYEGLSETIAHAVGGMLVGAADAGIKGGNVGMSALISGVSAGAANWLGTNVAWLGSTAKNPFMYHASNITKRAAIGAVIGGSTSAAMGGKFSQGAGQGAMTAGIAYATNHMLHESAKLAQRALNSNKNSGPTKDIKTQATTDSSADSTTDESKNSETKGPNWKTIGTGAVETIGGIGEVAAGLKFSAVTSGTGLLIAGGAIQNGIFMIGAGISDIMTGIYGNDKPLLMQMKDVIKTDPVSTRWIQEKGGF